MCSNIDLRRRLPKFIMVIGGSNDGREVYEGLIPFKRRRNTFATGEGGE